MDFLSSLSLRGQLNWLQATVSTILQNLIQTIIFLIYNAFYQILIVTEPHRRGFHRRAPCSRVHLAYSLRQLRVGISPPYALDPYDRSRNVLQTPRIHTLCSYCPRPVTLRCAFLSPTLSLRPILRLHDTTGAARSSVSPTSYL